MLYKITFTSLTVTSEEWLSIFNTILEATGSFGIHIVYGGRKVAFFLESKKSLPLLNSKLAPLFLSEEFTDQEAEAIQLHFPGAYGGAWIIRYPLFEFLERKHIGNSHVFRVSMSVKKYNPLQLFPVIQVWEERKSRVWKTSCISPLHLNAFLAFDLTGTVNAEIEKVKPMLAPGNVNIETSNNGILQLNRLNESSKCSVNSYDFWRHSLVIGQSGSGKSYLLKLLTEDIYRTYKNEYCVVLIDPHGTLETIIKGVSPTKRIDFKNTSTNLFVNIGQPVLSTELTIDLFSTVIDVHANQNLERVLKFSLNALYSTNAMTVTNLQSLLTDTLARKELLKSVTDQTILQFFDTEYQQLYTAQYATAVLPVINILSELKFLGNATENVDLVDTLNTNSFVSIPIKQSELGTNITRILGGSVIQQIFTVMQAGLVKKKVILMVDEVSVVQTPSLVHILSEARKFNLTLILAQQYLMQVSAQLLQSMFANTVNYFCFKLSRDDAEVVARNLNFEIDEYFLKNINDPREMLELGVRILVELNPREVISRLLVRDRFQSPFKSTTVHGIVEKV